MLMGIVSNSLSPSKDNLQQIIQVSRNKTRTLNIAVQKTTDNQKKMIFKNKMLQQ